MATVVKGFAIQGIDGYPVDIEVKTLEGQPMITIIGLGDLSVKEAAERIQASIDESGYVFPKKRVIISLAELPEFSRRTLDALRQPVEDKKVSISRVNGTHTYPSNFMFVAAMNPCPCGYYPGPKCRCTDYEIIKYRGKISGPIMDRIDIQKSVQPVNFFGMDEKEAAMSSELIRKRVEKARRIQQERYADEEGINSNAQMSTSLIQKYCVLDKESLQLLKEVSEEYGYSARVIHKLLRLARTSADLDESENIRMKDVQAVVSCRDLDQSNSKMMVVK